ncbi:MAG: hypothetical protein PHS41_01030 [Victivallaceae bacterium]|nr:hypothetical protein [Victivallaceae bacterium]
MKKFILSFMLGCVLLAGGTAQASDVTWGERIALYLPNRILDALDLFSLGLGVGPVVRAELMGSRACVVGAGAGVQAKVFKDYNRQYGWGIQDGWYWSFIVVGEEDMERRSTSYLVQKYYHQFAGIPGPDQRIFDFYTGARDYWQIGGALGLLVEAEVYLNPIEWVDFAAGFFFVDLRDDDLRFDNFR